MQAVTLRPISRVDLPLLGEWLREPAVAEWWHDDSDPAALEQRYGPVVDGTDPTHVLIASVDGVPFGLIQWYWFRDEAEYVAELRHALDVPDGAVSLDYLIGEESQRGRGLGAAMIAAVLQRVWAAGATTAIVPVHARNAASRAVLLRSGFRFVAEADLEPDNPGHDRRHVVYVADRPQRDG